jgi:flagellar biosynthesis protein FlhG
VTIAVTSGKGGVGKTNVVINLAVALARLRHRVAILDADFGLGNVDVLLGLSPAGHLGQVLTGEKTLAEVMVTGPLGICLIPASSGVRQMTALSTEHWQRLDAVLDEVADRFDYLIVDTAAGISDNVIDAIAIADHVLVVTSLEPTAVVDAYALIKVLSAERPGRDLGLLVNNVCDAAEAQLVFSQLEIASLRFLQRGLEYFGFIAHDPALREAVLLQRAVVDHFPQSSASRCFRILASRIAGSAPPRRQRLHLVAPSTATASPSTAEETEDTPCA